MSSACASFYTPPTLALRIICLCSASLQLTPQKGSGIGRETALAFASAGAAKIVLLGRKESTLMETKKALPKSCEGVVYVANVTDGNTLKEIASKIGTWDVLILNAGFISSPTKIADADIDDWWQNYEVCFSITRYMYCTALIRLFS